MADTGCPQMKQDSSANSKQMAALYGRSVQKVLKQKKQNWPLSTQAALPSS